MRVEKYPAPANALPYWAQIPDTFDGFVNIDFHGAGGQNWGSSETLDQLIIGTPPPYAETPKDLQNGCAAANILLLAPQKFGNWTVAEVNTMIDIAINKFGARKVGISGFSMGGGAVNGYITSQHSSRISWAISANGILPGGTLNWANAKAVRAWYYHTLDDPKVPYSTTTKLAVERMTAAGGNPKATIEAQGAHSYNNFFKQKLLYDWMRDGAFEPIPPQPLPPKTVTKVVVHYSDGTTQEMT